MRPGIASLLARTTIATAAATSLILAAGCGDDTGTEASAPGRVTDARSAPGEAVPDENGDGWVIGPARLEGVAGVHPVVSAGHDPPRYQLVDPQDGSVVVDVPAGTIGATLVGGRFIGTTDRNVERDSFGHADIAVTFVSYGPDGEISVDLDEPTAVAAVDTQGSTFLAVSERGSMSSLKTLTLFDAELNELATTNLEASFEVEPAGEGHWLLSATSSEPATWPDEPGHRPYWVLGPDLQVVWDGTVPDDGRVLTFHRFESDPVIVEEPGRSDDAVTYGDYVFRDVVTGEPVGQPRYWLAHGREGVAVAGTDRPVFLEVSEGRVTLVHVNVEVWSRPAGASPEAAIWTPAGLYLCFDGGWAVVDPVTGDDAGVSAAACTSRAQLAGSVIVDQIAGSVTAIPVAT